MKTTVVRFREADFWIALRYTLGAIGGIVMLFAIPKTICYFYADPLMAVVVLMAAAGWLYAVRGIR